MKKHGIIYAQSFALFVFNSTPGFKKSLKTKNNS